MNFMGKWVRIYIPGKDDDTSLILKDITVSAADHFRVQPEMITGRSNYRKHTLVRQACMYVLRTKHEKSYISIADAFGRNHTTVIHAVKTIHELITLCEKHHTVMQHYDDLYLFIKEKTDQHIKTETKGSVL